ncbi:MULTISPECIES: hypothetical protein [unclassified Rhodanobacter]|uniref:hypothetical protein n=1 Tax=unclassified Rhodanobacter TaxID=2621553 RepID=UPI0013966D7F|nr:MULTISPECIES: hypothetical protein [unclassified Rhodanobacter]
MKVIVVSNISSGAGSVAWPWAPQTSGFAPPTPKTDPAERREIDHQAQDVDRMDDDGAKPYEPEPEPGKR